MFLGILPHRAHFCIVVLVGLVGLLSSLAPHSPSVVLVEVPWLLWLLWRLAIAYVLLSLGCWFLFYVLAEVLGQEVDCE
jgi:uncharacterized BrkB/YihY/UPF0761 family membrane protein